MVLSGRDDLVPSELVQAHMKVVGHPGQARAFWLFVSPCRCLLAGLLACFPWVVRASRAAPVLASPKCPPGTLPRPAPVFTPPARPPAAAALQVLYHADLGHGGVLLHAAWQAQVVASIARLVRQ